MGRLRAFRAGPEPLALVPGKCCQLLKAGRMPHFFEGVGFNLTHAFAGDFELATNFFERPRLAVHERSKREPSTSRWRLGNSDTIPPTVPLISTARRQ